MGGHTAHAQRCQPPHTHSQEMNHHLQQSVSLAHDYYFYDYCHQYSFLVCFCDAGSSTVTNKSSSAASSGPDLAPYRCGLIEYFVTTELVLSKY